MQVKLLLLLLIANGVPILARNLLGQRWSKAIDGERVLADGNRLFGDSKTWRGLVVSVLFTGLCSVLLGFTLLTGVIIASGAMAGDLLSSYIKRRKNMPPSSMATGLDQLPESLLPLVLIAPILDLSITDILLLVVVFFVVVLALSKILYQLNIRKRPY